MYRRVAPHQCDKHIIFDDDNDVIQKVVNEIYTVIDVYEVDVKITKLRQVDTNDFDNDFTEEDESVPTVFVVTMDTNELFTSIFNRLLNCDQCATFVLCTDDEMEIEEFNSLKRKLEKKIREKESQTKEAYGNAGSEKVNLHAVKNFDSYSTWIPGMLKFLFNNSKKPLIHREIGVLFPIKTGGDFVEPRSWSMETTRMLENVFQIKCAARETSEVVDRNIFIECSQVVCIYLNNGNVVRVGNKMNTSLLEEEVKVINMAKENGCGVLIYIRRATGDFLGEMKAKYNLDVSGYGPVSYYIESLRLLGMVKLTKKPDMSVYTSGECTNFRSHYETTEIRPITRREGYGGDANIDDIQPEAFQPVGRRGQHVLSLHADAFNDVCLVYKGQMSDKKSQQEVSQTYTSCRVCVIV